MIDLEGGVEMNLVSNHIGELRAQEEALEAALAEIRDPHREEEDEEPMKRLEALPDLAENLRKASPQIKRQVFQAFDLQIAFDKRGCRVEISATVSEAVAKSFNSKDPLAREGLSVVPKDIAGAGFEPATFGL